MPALKNVVGETRTLLKWTGLILGALLLIFIFFKTGTLIKNLFFPAPSPRPAAAFGKLPTPFFPKSKANERLSYTVDTLSGTLPIFPDRVKIYKTVAPKPALLAFENIQRRVSLLGFNSEGIALGRDTYQWETKDKTKKIAVNIFSSDFTFSSSFIAENKIQNAVSLEDKNKAFNIATSFTESIIPIPSDLDLAKTRTMLFAIENGIAASAAQDSIAKIIRVDFFQKDIDQLPIYYANGSPMNMLLGKTQEELQVIEAKFLHQTISNDSSVYPIKTASEALSELSSGRAYIDSIPQNTQHINIKQVTLGWYLGEKRQDYLLPIVVFEDDKGFKAFVSAVTDEWVNK